MSLIRVDLRGAITCYGPNCSNSRDVCRHHKGHDSFIGRFNKAVKLVYGQYQFCVPLCPDCHCKIHYNYIPIIQAHRSFTPAGALKLRKKLIKFCDEWLSGKRTLIEPPPEFKKQFLLGYSGWKITQKSQS